MGHISFNGLALATAPGLVMTPRRASEAIVDEAVAVLGDRPARVVDVGTGSGAIAVAVAAALPNVHVWATDTSRCAVALARANARAHGLSKRVTVRYGDLLDPVPGAVELIVANLPYLPLADAPRYPELALEPPHAVFAPGDGLDSYRRLLGAAEERLTKDGTLVIQLHRRVLAASRRELGSLAELLERYPRAPSMHGARTPVAATA